MNLIKIQPKRNQETEKYCFQAPNQSNSSNIQRQNLYGMPSNNKTGHWSEKENAKYFAFLKKFKEKFSEKESRRQWKVFKTLSEFVKTRNANQCRSHHHKMQRNFETIEQTLEFLRKKSPALQKRCEKYTHQLQKINTKIFSQRNSEIQKVENEVILKDNLLCPSSHSIIQVNNDYPNDKKIAIQNLRTGLTEGEPDNIMAYQPLGCYFGPPQKKFDMFPTTGLLSSTDQENKVYNQFTEIYKGYSIQNMECQNIGQSQSYQEKLMECQQMFTKWYRKVNELIMSQQKEDRQRNAKSHQNEYVYFSTL